MRQHQEVQTFSVATGRKRRRQALLEPCADFLEENPGESGQIFGHTCKKVSAYGIVRTVPIQ